MKRTGLVWTLSVCALGGAASAAPGSEDTPPEFVEEVIAPALAGDCKMAGDIDGDGMIDAVVGGMPGEGLRWLRWPDWRQTLIATPAVEFTTDGELGDVDGDGDLDLVVPDGPGDNALAWFRNPRPSGDPGAGAWARVTIGTTGDYTKDVELRDFDADGRLDVACRTGSRAFVFFQNAGGSWTRVEVGPALSGEGMSSGDIDADGDADLVVPGRWLRNPRPGGNARTAAWSPFTFDASAPTTSKSLVADINADGRMDIAVSNSEGAGPVKWYTPSGPALDPTGAWQTHLVVALLDRCHTLQAGDVDSDGDLDLVVGQLHTSPTGALLVMLNLGAGLGWSASPIGSGGMHNGVLADFGGDADLDLFGSNYTGHPPVRLFKNERALCAADLAPPSGTLDYSDILAFLQAFALGLPAGDLAPPIGTYDFSDVVSFLVSFGAGCP